MNPSPRSPPGRGGFFCAPARVAHRMAHGGETLHDVAAPALKQLYEHGQLRHILTQPDDERMRALLEEAERLCTDLLEAR